MGILTVRLTDEEEQTIARRSRQAQGRRAVALRAQIVKQCLLDSSFLIDLLNEMADDREGPAFAWLRRNPKAQLWISPITLAEVLEAAGDAGAVKVYLGRYAWQGNHRMHAEAVAARQKRSARRMGENDAWQCAVAERAGAIVVGHGSAFEPLGPRYADHRRNDELPA
jgi:predicted nucleic acid-binding protein